MSELLVGGKLRKIFRKCEICTVGKTLENLRKSLRKLRKNRRDLMLEKFENLENNFEKIKSY